MHKFSLFIFGVFYSKIMNDPCDVLPEYFLLSLLSHKLEQLICSVGVADLFLFDDDLLSSTYHMRLLCGSYIKRYHDVSCGQWTILQCILNGILLRLHSFLLVSLPLVFFRFTRCSSSSESATLFAAYLTFNKFIYLSFSFLKLLNTFLQI